MRILWLQKRLLFPADRGAKIRTLNVVRHLARWHEVTYLSNVSPEEQSHVREMRELGVRLEAIPWTEAPRGSLRFYFQLAANSFSPNPFSVAKDTDRRLRRRAVELLRSEPFDVVVCDFVQMARNATGLNTPARILFQHNVEAQIFARHARTDRGLLRRAVMWLQWRKMRRFEARAGHWFDAVVCVSPEDQRTFQREYGWTHVHTIDTAVDTEYFRPNGALEQEDRVVFVGSLDWPPNQDGLRRLADEIWPVVRQRRPHAQLAVVGRNPQRDVRALAERPGIDVVGSVPDVRPYLAGASVVVVPLWVGGGTRLKIFEAMAMQKAVVSTPVGAEGLPVVHGTHLLVADRPNEFADCVVQLLEDRSRRTELAARARELVTTRFSAQTVARQFERICQETVEAARGEVLGARC